MLYCYRLQCCELGYCILWAWMLEAGMGFCVVVEIDEAVEGAMSVGVGADATNIFILELPLSISVTHALLGEKQKHPY